jgi:hypothetical protein
MQPTGKATRVESLVVAPQKTLTTLYCWWVLLPTIGRSRILGALHGERKVLFNSQQATLVEYAVLFRCIRLFDVCQFSILYLRCVYYIYKFFHKTRQEY